MQSVANKASVQRGELRLQTVLIGMFEVAVAMGTGMALANFLVLWYMN